MEHIRHIPAWSRYPELVSGFTIRAFGSLSTRSDSPEVVEQRYQALAQHFGVAPAHLFTLPQTHSNNVAIIRDRDSLERPEGRRAYRPTETEVYAGGLHIDTASFDMAWQRGIDGAILAVDDVFAVVSTADCAPVMFWAPASRVCGIAHVGLVGAVNQLAPTMVSLMHREFSVPPSALEVAILPSIRGCHYNVTKSGVWQRLHRAITAAYGIDNPFYRDGYFNLPGFIRWQLESAGVREAHIHDLGVCTVCKAQDFFSHVQAGATGSQEKEGRFGSIIGVRHAV